MRFILTPCLALAWLASSGGGEALGAPPPQNDPPTALWEIVTEVARQNGIGAEVDAVVEHLRGVPRERRVAGRLSRVLDTLANPWSAPHYAEALRDLLLEPLHGRTAEFGDLLPQFASWLDLPERADESAGRLEEMDELWREVCDSEVVGIELLERISEYLGAAHDALAAGLEQLSEPSREALFGSALEAHEAWYRTHFPGAPDDSDQLETMRRFRVAVLEVDRSVALRVAARLMRFSDSDFRKTLGKRLARTPRNKEFPDGVTKADFGGDVVAIVGSTRETRVVLGGRRTTQYAGAAACVIDLGGDDVYARAAVVDDPGMLVSVVLDLRGDDRYESAEVGPAVAIGGVALLIDQEGEDVYRGGRWSQAAAVAGVAVLVDTEGDDVYAAEDYGQAYAYCGVALLYDVAGTDRYDAWAYAQGAGIGPGLSALVDGAGDDRYIADGHWPDVYGDSGPDIFHGASQGYSTGLRGAAPELAGGFAALIDADGDDRYQAGNFAQGGGYYFGFGLMYDGGGNDENHGSRYAHGFGVHQAVGVRWDEAGDDSYHMRSVAHCGSAWDEGVGWLIETEGDDTYEIGGLGLGGAAQTAVAVLFDGAGRDRYSSGGGADTQGGAGPFDYHDLQSVGVLIDLGSSGDEYSKSDRGDDVTHTSARHGIFVDSREKTIARLRKRLGR